MAHDLTQYKQLLKNIADFGEQDAPEFVGHLKTAVAELQACRDLAVKRFSTGLSGQQRPDGTFEVSCENDHECAQLEKEVVKKCGLSAGNAGSLIDTLRQIGMLIVQNPALLQIILSWFQPKPATA